MSWSDSNRGAADLSHVEDISAFDARGKLRGIPEGKAQVVLEVVLHNAGKDRIVEAFGRYARDHCGAEPLMTRRRNVRGLTFIPVRTAPGRAEDLARFSFVRVARGMPSLRPLRPSVLRVAPAADVKLPTDGPFDASFRAVVFDGGIPRAVRSRLAPWVSLIEPSGIGAAVPEYEAHGLAVTSAVLFGPLDGGDIVRRPICAIDHVRVLDVATNSSDLEYHDVLDRILGFLDSNGGRHEFVNISLGPNLAVDDDDVTAWTASLDERLAHGERLPRLQWATMADESVLGSEQCAAPADAVNVLAVGLPTVGDQHGVARTTVAWGRDATQNRKTLGMFGSDAELYIMGPSGKAEGIKGTGSRPFVALSGLGREQLGTKLTPLVIERSSSIGLNRRDMERRMSAGTLRGGSNLLITSDDNEALVVFQEVAYHSISPGSPFRARGCRGW